MPGKEKIIREIGEESILLPLYINSAIEANERIKYYFSLLQAAKSYADNPATLPQIPEEDFQKRSDKNDKPENVIFESSLKEEDIYFIPGSSEIVSDIGKCIDEMIKPLSISGYPPAEEFKERYETISGRIPEISDSIITGNTISQLISGIRKKGDSMHILVMDIHKALNDLQAGLSHEEIDRAKVCKINESDIVHLKAFMEGLNSTRILKFGHPGLDTTATSTSEGLIIQNDIGVTDAHVIVIKVKDGRITFNYTDIHRQRLDFFRSLFRNHAILWNDTRSKNVTDFEKDIFFLAKGTFYADNKTGTDEFLKFLGSRIVFLIDWNKARKNLRKFLRSSDCIKVLIWAADNNYGHRGFLVLGGSTLIYEALEIAADVPIRYGEPLHIYLGRERASEFFRCLLMTASTGLIEKKPELFIKDEIKALLLRQIKSARQSLLDIIAEHASLITAESELLLQSLESIQSGGEKLCLKNINRAKFRERRADDIVNRVRAVTKRMKDGAFYSELISLSDDALDYIEDSISVCGFDPPLISDSDILSDMIRMADTVNESCMQYQKTIHIFSIISGKNPDDEMNAFLLSVDMVVETEEICDRAFRDVQKSIMLNSKNFREAMVSSEITKGMEEAVNSLMKSAFLIRENVLENLNR
ncbi:hypothetical protein [Methanoplanus limicola]|uniref:Uncharacterized protein n=1 Tax=Methanoplanus limicola DSM 2279 TaxID=937775 RepID=H1Z3X8_9EURY|nr:hypothetical protein [Methanoplanus limicola]EHQ36600.1 hypothetical protein Metlim_2558 [Methanoplanus limicola DSM 2279]